MAEEDIDEELAKIEAEIKAIEETPSGFSSPITHEKQKDTLIQLAREMIETEDTRKFAFLEQKYIGLPKMPVNNYLEIANYCEVEGMEELGKIFRKEAETVLATSLSIQGFFSKLLVTQIKKDEKPESSEQKKKSWSLFKNKHEVNANV